MKTALVLSLLVMGSVASANTFGSIRADKSNCLTVQKYVQTKGAVLVYYGQDLFKRVVSSGQYCEASQHTTPSYVPTINNKYCFAGYACVESDD